MTTYSITLDDVDLAFLPLRTHKYNDFLKKENFQFHVMKTETVEDPVPTVHYTCHVCAIEVPASFASEHVASIKHRANVRIASIAMQRTQKLIASLPPPFSETIHPPSGRFCRNCVIIADGDHDKTKEHRVAATHDNLLWELMKAYVGELEDGELKDDYKKNMKTENQGVDRIGDHDIYMEFENMEFDYLEFENNRNTATVVSVVDKNPPTTLSDSTYNSDRTSDNDKIKIIDSDLDIFVNDHSNSSNPAQKTTKNQKKEKTKSKHEAVVSNCDSVISNNTEKHNKDEGFSKLETKKNNAAITKQTESNTGINKDILDTSKHQDAIKNMRNRKSLKEVGKIETDERSSKHDDIMPTNSREKEAPAKITDEITNKTYLNEPSNIVTNEITREHIAKYFEIRSPYEIELSRTCNNTNAEFKEVKNQIYIKTSDDVLIVKKDNFHSYDRMCNNEIKCIVCDLVFNDKFERLHTHDIYHRRRVSNIGNDDNYVRKVNNMYSHCILCNIKIHYTVLAMHKQDFYHLRRKKTHTFTIVSGQKQQEPFKDKPNDNIIDLNIEYPYEAVFGEIRCLICDCRVPKDLQNRIDHSNGSRHAKNMEKLKTSVPPRSSQEPFPWYF